MSGAIWNCPKRNSANTNSGRYMLGHTVYMEFSLPVRHAGMPSARRVAFLVEGAPYNP